jgi:Family of unknown function (DUF6353)
MLTGLVQSQFSRVKFLVNDNSTTILTGVGVTGTVVTAYLTGRASFRAAQIIAEDEKIAEDLTDKSSQRDGNGYFKLPLTKKVKRVWRLYLPAVAVGTTTITSIIVANKVASKKIAALTIASGISERALQEYKTKVVEKLGERQDQKVRDEIAQDRVTKNPPGSREVILAGTGEVLCYDMHTGRYFQSTIEEIKRAENQTNHELLNFMSASLSSFYDHIGLPSTTYTDTVGWNSNNLIEVTFSTVLSPDQKPCVAIDFVHPPVPDYHRMYD